MSRRSAARRPSSSRRCCRCSRWWPLCAYAVLAARSAHEQAGAAAEAGAVALLQDRDARAAARGALPRGARAKVAVDGARVRGHGPPARARPRRAPPRPRRRRRGDAMRQAAATAGRRAAGYFIAPREPPPAAEVTRLVPRDRRALSRGGAGASAARRAATPAVPRSRPASRSWAGGRGVPVAVAVANALRARRGAPVGRPRRVVAGAAAAAARRSPARRSRGHRHRRPSPARRRASRPRPRRAGARAARVAASSTSTRSRRRSPSAASSGAVDVPVVAVLAGPRTAGPRRAAARAGPRGGRRRATPGGALARLAARHQRGRPPFASPAAPRRVRRALLACAGLAGARGSTPGRWRRLGRLGEPVPYALSDAAMSARGQASILFVGGLAGVLVGALILGAVAPRGRRARARRSGPPTSPRSPAPGRCTRRTRGCSSRR